MLCPYGVRGNKFILPGAARAKQICRRGGVPIQGRCFDCALQQRGKTRVLTGAVGADREESTAPPTYHFDLHGKSGAAVGSVVARCRRRSRGGLREYAGKDARPGAPAATLLPSSPRKYLLAPRRRSGVPIGSSPLHLDERDGTPVSAAWWRWWEGFLLTRQWWQD